VTDFYIGARAPVLVVHSFNQPVNVEKLSTHAGDTILRRGTNEECVKETGLSLGLIHPFLENYWWKVLDEKIFENETIYIRAGVAGEILRVEANALKYVIGVVNGLLAEVTN
ncbi:MAG: YbaK/EbsC family protein, partial [archaeon]